MTTDSYPEAAPRVRRIVARARDRTDSLPAVARRATARLERIGLLGVAAVLNLWGLGVNGWANTCYAAAVRSIFGFHPLSLLVPEALMGVLAVGLLYDLVRRRFGRVAGFVAGLALASTPTTVAISRHNNPDALLALCCVAALWFFVKALEDGRTRWLVLSGICVGLGFETKMLVALTILPGMALAWFWWLRAAASPPRVSCSRSGLRCSSSASPGHCW